MAATPKERKLRSEIEEIAQIAGIDFRQNYRGHRLTQLEIIRDKLVRGDVIQKYAFLDEYLTDIICDYYFYRPPKAHYGALWKTKRFRIFVHYIMDEMFMLKTLSVVGAIKDVPKEVSNAIKRINDVRSDLAHILFPKNRRRYMANKKVIYQGTNLFSVEGVEMFHRDYTIAEKWLRKKVLR